MAENNYEVVHTTPPVYVIPTAIDPAPRKFKRSCVTVYFGETMLFDYVDPEFNTLSKEQFDGTMESAIRIAFDCVQAYKFPRCSLDLWFAGANTAKFTVELSDYERILGANRKEVTWTRWADGWTFADFEQGAILNGLPAPSKNQGTYVDNKGDNYVPNDGSKASLLIKRSQLVDNYAALPAKSVIAQKISDATVKRDAASSGAKYKYYKPAVVLSKETEFFSLINKTYNSDSWVNSIANMKGMGLSYNIGTFADRIQDELASYLTARRFVIDDSFKTTDPVAWGIYNTQMNDSFTKLETLKTSAGSIMQYNGGIAGANQTAKSFIEESISIWNSITTIFNSYGFVPFSDLYETIKWFYNQPNALSYSSPEGVLDTYEGSIYNFIPWMAKANAYGSVMDNTYSDTTTASYPFAFRYWACNPTSPNWTQARHDKIRLLLRLIDQYYGQCVQADPNRFYADPVITEFVKTNVGQAVYEAKITSLIDEIVPMIPFGSAGSSTTQIKNNITACWNKWKDVRGKDVTLWATGMASYKVIDGYATYNTSSNTYPNITATLSGKSILALRNDAITTNPAYVTANGEVTKWTTIQTNKNNYESQIFAIDAQIVAIDSSYVADPLP